MMITSRLDSTPLDFQTETKREREKVNDYPTMIDKLFTPMMLLLVPSFSLSLSLSLCFVSILVIRCMQLEESVPWSHVLNMLTRDRL